MVVITFKEVGMEGSGVWPKERGLPNTEVVHVDPFVTPVKLSELSGKLAGFEHDGRRFLRVLESPGIQCNCLRLSDGSLGWLSPDCMVRPLHVRVSWGYRPLT